jgi:hypothetical protein
MIAIDAVDGVESLRILDRVTVRRIRGDVAYVVAECGIDGAGLVVPELVELPELVESEIVRGWVPGARCGSLDTGDGGLWQWFYS